MIPKVYLYGARAASHVQNQAGHSFRNVLQLQSAPVVNPSSGSSILNLPGAASSSWGAGGSQSYTYQGYTGAGRAITQANSSSNDSSSASDDIDDVPRRISPLLLSTSPSTRPRSNSLSTIPANGRIHRGNELGVLKVVRLHARFRHAFSTPKKDAHPLLLEANGAVTPIAPVPHRNSTTLAAALPESSALLPLPFSPWTHPSQSATKSAPYDRKQLLSDAIASRDAERISTEIEILRNKSDKTITEFNLCLHALKRTRKKGQPITAILELYNEILASGMVPSPATYRHVISALCDRDLEVHTVLKVLEKRRNMLVRKSLTLEPLEEQRFEQLSTEGNYTSALALFQAASFFRDSTFHVVNYNLLLRSAGFRGDVDNALRVFGHLESRPTIQPDRFTYLFLHQVYATAHDIEGAKEVFDEFVAAAKERRLSSAEVNALHDGEPASDKSLTIRIYENMIVAYIKCGQPEKGIELLEVMIDSGSSIDPDGIPLPVPTTYSRIITGFCYAGDAESALVWYHRLNQPSSTDAVTPAVPDTGCWMTLLHTLIAERRYEDVNRLMHDLVQSNGSIHPRSIDIEAWTRCISDAAIDKEVDAGRKWSILESAINMMPSVLSCQTGERLWDYRAFEPVIQAAIDRQELVAAVRVLSAHAAYHSRFDAGRERNPTVRSNFETYAQWWEALADQILSKIGTGSQGDHMRLLLDLAKSAQDHQLLPALTRRVSNNLLQAFASYLSYEAMSADDWSVLTRAFCDLELAHSEELSGVSPPPLQDLIIRKLVHIAQDNIYNAVDIKRLTAIVQDTRGYETAYKIFEPLGPTVTQQLSPPPPSPSPSTGSVDPSWTSETDFAQESVTTMADSIPMRSTSDIRIDLQQSRFVDEHTFGRLGVTPLQAFARHEQGARAGVYPTPDVQGRLINALGRIGEISKVQQLYAEAQLVLASLEQDKTKQSAGWFQIEDQMITALAHSGNPDAANVHRLRIINHGGAPTADAYGALINSIKDTTDDPSVARELFEESVRLQVLPNLYLYNIIISKMAKARKADFALELFHRMPALHLRPSSVTYGAVIAACCRVGDEEAAIFLFDEMITLRDYKPRVPPYNTMIQFFVHSKPNRERAIHYYQRMRDAGLLPTAHTYKLLLDAYGTIEPVDVVAMEEIFKLASDDPRVTIQGSHWSALINAFGCVHRDLDRALEVFETMKTKYHPDAVVYEALVNVLVTLKRVDLAPRYLEDMQDNGVHQTAYIANALIKGYATIGDIKKARSTFEALVDPPIGVAAPGNHGQSLPVIPPDAPVYREPSSWEAIIRAELAVGERDKANLLMARLEARAFPGAVTSRIRSIMGESEPL